jgi:small subunit ribosomal protein S4
MTKRINAKHKVDRRLKVNLWGRPKSPFNTRAYPPGQHGQNKRGKPTDYGIQLFAKQKLKSYYGNINERQFRNIYRKALTKRGDTTENLIGLLESRLDTVIYRGKFTPTVFAARQLINHGHVRVNKKKVNISSYLVKETDEIEIKEKSKTLAMIDGALSSKERDVPEYIQLDDKNKKVKLIRIPKFAEVPYPVIMEPNLNLNFFSLYKRQLLYLLKKKTNIDISKKEKNFSLENLFTKYGSDKAQGYYTEEYIGHGYTKFYLKNLQKLKFKKINILEIGSYAGASAAAFSKFFSKSIKKINIDKKDGYFDIIIDDGSHHLGDILKVFKFYFKYLKPNGFYIIEDYKLPNFFKHLNEVGEPKIDKFINFVKKKQKFKSKILSKYFQSDLFKKVASIQNYHGKNKNSDIVFLKKN